MHGPPVVCPRSVAGSCERLVATAYHCRAPVTALTRWGSASLSRISGLTRWPSRIRLSADGGCGPVNLLLTVNAFPSIASEAGFAFERETGFAFAPPKHEATFAFAGTRGAFMEDSLKISPLLSAGAICVDCGAASRWAHSVNS